MKNSLIAFFTLIFFTACSISNPNQNRTTSKEELIKASQNGDLNAMYQLNKHYKFPETKEGLYYFEKWYENIKKEQNPQKITKLALIYDKYSDMFINGNEKAHKLYTLAANLGDENANIELIKSYLKSYKRDEAKALEDKIIDSLSEEQMQNLYLFYSKNYFSRQTKNIEKKMKEKSFELPVEAVLTKIRRASYKKSEEKKVNELIKSILDKKNSEGNL